MNSRHAVLIVMSILLLCALSTGSAAIWVKDGIPVCSEPDDQTMSAMCSDGAGGAFLAWMDEQPGTGNIFAQHIDASGQKLWEAGGLVICSATNIQQRPAIVATGNGGAIIAWEDYRSGSNYDIYAQYVDADGTKHWTASGREICTAANNQTYPCLTTDGAGGAYIAWVDSRGGATSDIYVQRILPEGFTYFVTNGAAVCTAANNQAYVAIVSDDAFGAIVAWGDGRSGGAMSLYAQRVRSWGGMEWTANGMQICSATGNQVPFGLTADGAGGAIFAWRDARVAPSYGVYAQRINTSGTLQWASTGVVISTEQSAIATPRVLADGAGGAFVAWESQAEDSNGDVFAQRINSGGTTLWQENGVPVCVVWDTQNTIFIVPDGTGGLFAAWSDQRSGYAIFAQRLDGNGNRYWGSLGLAICTASSIRMPEAMISDGAGGAYLSWNDYRSAYGDIYMQQFDGEGRFGYHPPVIHSAADVPGDQGGSVNLAWDATIYDYLSDEITTYSIWRALPVAAAQALIDKGAALFENTGDIAKTSAGAPLLRVSQLGGTDYYWEYLMYQNASGLEHYGRVVPTVFDCTIETGAATNYFQIIAHTSDPDIYFVSDPDSGCSVDNLAPAAPMNVTGNQSIAPAGLRISWDPNTEPDLGCYRVYRGLSADFIPGPGNLLYVPCDPEVFDGQWHWDSGYYYKISALDIHGNESARSLFDPDNVTGAEDEPPFATFLARNYPNPFNPATSIRFGIAERARVTLAIYDAAGRPVRMLVDETRDAAIYTEHWQGRDSAGRPVSSGVYFYRLTAGDFEQTNKMILLK